LPFEVGHGLLEQHVHGCEKAGRLNQRGLEGLDAHPVDHLAQALALLILDST